MESCETNSCVCSIQSQGRVRSVESGLACIDFWDCGKCRRGKPTIAVKRAIDCPYRSFQDFRASIGFIAKMRVISRFQYSACSLEAAHMQRQSVAEELTNHGRVAIVGDGFPAGFGVAGDPGKSRARTAISTATAVVRQPMR